MAGFYGADTDALRDVAGVFQDRSSRLAELRDQLDAAVMREDIWTGGDADAFRDRWTGVSARFGDASDGVGRRRGELEEQAEQQDDASGEDGGGGGLLDAVGNLFDDVKGGLNDLRKAISKIGKGVKAFKLFRDLARLGEAGYEGLKGLINQQFIDELVDKTRAPAAKIMDFLHGKGWTRVADVAEGILDSGLVKGAGKVLGKALPVLDIGMGIHQMVTAEDGWDVASGGLSTLSGGLLLAAPFTGPAAPIVAGVGLVAGGLSLGIDAGKAIVENWDTTSDTAGKARDATTDAAGDAADGAGDFLSDPIGSIF